MKKARAVVVVLLLAMVLLVTTPVYADTADPDYDPTVEEINVYRNLIEPGDMLFLVYANIPYGTPPSTPVTSTFIWRLIDVDGITTLGSTVGTAYNDDGYGYNVYSMYFTAAEVAASLVWNTVYNIRLSGNPTVFDAPPEYNYPVAVLDYTTAVTQADNQAELAARIITLAGDLDNKWALAPTYSLLTQNETATVLSIYGEAFFRGAINGLQAMAPLAFSVVIRALEITDRTWTDNYSENLTGQYTGTWVDTAKAAGAVLFGTDYDLLSIIILLVMCGGLMIGNLMLTGDHWNGLIDVAALCVVGARLAMYDLAFLILIAALCWMYISAKIWFGMIK